MTLQLDRRSYGTISIVRCFGVIVVGDSLGKLEEELREGLRESKHILLNMSGVDRLDSTGMGLLVRFLSRARDNGGDLRLCSPDGFVRKLLAATRLDSVFLVYTSEYNAIQSFFTRGVPGEARREFAATVLLLHPSEDLCAFARSVLEQHGYEVLTTNCCSDAKLLAQAAQPSLILIDAQAAEPEGEAVVPALKAAAPDATMIALPADFGQSQPHHAAATLLNALKQSKPAHGHPAL